MSQAGANSSSGGGGGGGIVTIDGDTGSMTGTTVTISGDSTGLTTTAAGTTMDLSGTLNVAHGGTGATSLSGILLGNGTSAVTAVTTGNDGVFITSDTGVPSWLANGNTGDVLTATTGSPPSWQPAGGGSGVTQINADTGSATPSFGVIVLQAQSSFNNGSTVLFSASGAGIDLLLTDPVGANTFIGQNAGNLLGSGSVSNNGLGSGSFAALNGGDNNNGLGNGVLANLVDGFNNLALGDNAGTSYTSNEGGNILLSNAGVNAESNTIRIGTVGTQTSCFIAGIDGVTVTGLPVLCDTNGQLGDVSSSIEFKENVQNVSDTTSILNLRPVSFNYKSDKDKSNCYGMIAEEVEKIIPELVVYKEGTPYGIKYHEMPALLLKEIQRLRDRVVYLESRVC